MATPQHFLKVCERLDLAFVSKAERPFGLVQGAASGVISARSCIQCRAIGSVRWFLWVAIIVGLTQDGQTQHQAPGG
jgi:hypothetical protein